jgi:alanyl-tRNA synthetase
MHWPVDLVRKTFVDYFAQKHAHTFVPSSPSVPVDDPTLLFTNAGMNQFKPLFLGSANPNTNLGKLKRAVNSQKCIRAGGKHNDLDDVGKDTYHHTFFEMLGNWSFGDYFKKEAIAWSWELLTQVYKLPGERLYATYFEGNPALNMEPDTETRELWLKYLPPQRVIPGNMNDNFWEMGDTGPCGPSTEIHFDRIGGRDAREFVNKSDPDVIEIWNNVFIQFNREQGGVLKPLPAKHVDTGMGLERLTSILQNVRSNYDTDVFMPIFARIEQLTGARSYMGKLGKDDVDSVDTAYRVIADHIRTLTFAINDGATPSNVGRGYVLRRILRRAVRYGRQMLGAKTSFFSQLVPTVVERFGGAFPELKKDPHRIAAIILDEEESFGKTLDRGIKLFAEVADAAKATSTISGSDAFKLYDTFGFPIDLTVLMAQERGLTVDMEGYEREQARAQEVSKAGPTKDSVGSLPFGADQAAGLKHLRVEPTQDEAKHDIADDGGARTIRAHIRAIWNGHNFDENLTTSTGNAKKLIAIITDRTNFYATMGGQEGDTGEIHVTTSAGRSHTGEFEVHSTSAFAGYVLHVGHLQKGELHVGDTVSMQVDRARRSAIMSNHTATHLANWALREVLGSGVEQKGSLVAPDRFRFDFTAPAPVSAEQAAKVEALVTQQIAANHKVFARVAPLTLARTVEGVRAVFGEAYPDPVRVISLGADIDDLLNRPQDPRWKSHSIEFCGGTHVGATGQIGAFALIAEEAVAKGVRRIVAVTGQDAAKAQMLADGLAKKIDEAAKIAPGELGKAVTSLSQEIDAASVPMARKASLRLQLLQLQEKVKAAGKEVSVAVTAQAVSQARTIAQGALAANTNVVVAQIECGEDRAALQAAVKVIRDSHPRAAVMLFAIDEAGKAMIHASVPDALVAKGLKAGDWLREASAAMGGKGGGKPDNAQGGAPDGSKVRDAMRTAEQVALKLVM